MTCSEHVCLLMFWFSTDKPSKTEKVRMAESIIAAFPVLKASGSMGYVSSHVTVYGSSISLTALL